MNYKRLQSPPVWVPEAIGSMIWCFNVLQWIHHVISLLRVKFLHSQNSFPVFLLPPPYISKSVNFLGIVLDDSIKTFS